MLFISEKVEKKNIFSLLSSHANHLLQKVPSFHECSVENTYKIISTAMAVSFLSGTNHARIYGQENLYKALEERPENTPLITVANHHSCMDEPLIWGKL